jgi:FixJ family two-component response regulator
VTRRHIGASRLGNGECRLSKGPVISIVEDDAAVRAATENLVKSVGFGVYTFASAEEFLRSNRVAETACLISDVQMPNMSGVELQASLANRGFRIPTIFMTAFPDESVRRRAMDAGAVGFLHKPFNGKALIQFIQDAISKGGWKS